MKRIVAAVLFLYAIAFFGSAATAEEIGLGPEGKRDELSFEMLSTWEGVVTFKNSIHENSVSHWQTYLVTPEDQCMVQINAQPGKERIQIDCTGFWVADPKVALVADGEEVSISILSQAF